MEPRMRATAAALVAIMTNLIGASLGPLLVGGLSDHFARLACGGARCSGASAVGLQWAFMATALIYLWAAAHFALAARTLRRDLA
jgi:hypothetical protein